MGFDEALAKLEQLIRERESLNEFYSDLLEESEEQQLLGEQPGLPVHTRVLIRQLAAALKTERDQSNIALDLLIHICGLLFPELGIPLPPWWPDQSKPDALT